MMGSRRPGYTKARTSKSGGAKDKIKTSIYIIKQVNKWENLEEKTD